MNVLNSVSTTPPTSPALLHVELRSYVGKQRRVVAFPIIGRTCPYEVVVPTSDLDEDRLRVHVMPEHGGGDVMIQLPRGTLHGRANARAVSGGAEAIVIVARDRVFADEKREGCLVFFIAYAAMGTVAILLACGLNRRPPPPPPDPLYTLVHDLETRFGPSSPPPALRPGDR